MKTQKQPDHELLEEQTKRIKAAKKSFSQHNYTPHISGILASVFVVLSYDDTKRQIGVMGLINRILEGKNK